MSVISLSTQDEGEAIVLFKMSLVSVLYFVNVFKFLIFVMYSACKKPLAMICPE